MDIREVGGEYVALDGDRVLHFSGPAADDYRAGGMTRRQMLTRIGVGVAVAGVSYVALPMAAAHASDNGGATVLVGLSPSTGPIGQLVTVTVSGLSGDTGTVIQTVTVGGITVTPSNTTVTNGTASFTITIPANLFGQVSVVVTDNHHNTGSAIFTVTPTVSVSPSTGLTKNQQDTLTVSGSGFTPGTVTATVGGNGFSMVAGSNTVTADLNGNIVSGSTVKVNAPNGTSKSTTITFTDTATRSASTTIAT